jgi:hypothetical protein
MQSGDAFQLSLEVVICDREMNLLAPPIVYESRSQATLHAAPSSAADTSALSSGIRNRFQRSYWFLAYTMKSLSSRSG